jgi:response regulator RpfG family c-di-GMP phosphodiesterase
MNTNETSEQQGALRATSIDSKMKHEKTKILFLDDESQNLLSFASNMRDTFQVFTAESPIDAYSIIERENIQIVIADHNMPSISGVEFLEVMRKDFPQVVRILATAFPELVSVREAVNRGSIYRLITKPFDFGEIQLVLETAEVLLNENKERDDMIRKLRIQNQQYEFILRQRLLVQ